MELNNSALAENLCQGFGCSGVESTLEASGFGSGCASGVDTAGTGASGAACSGCACFQMQNCGRSGLSNSEFAGKI